MADIPGCCLALELTKNGEMMWIVNIYAPNNGCERIQFFQKIESYLDGNVMLLGDFNSVTCIHNHLSGKLETSSLFLDMVLNKFQLSKPVGSHLESFSYHHPSIPGHKSCLDRIYVNFPCTRLWGF